MLKSPLSHIEEEKLVTRMKKTREFEDVPYLTERQRKGQAKKQAEFLRLVHPSLNESGWSSGAVELRPLRRDPGIKEFVPSFNTWKMENKDEEELMKFLEKINGKGYCLYFSTYAFDRANTELKADGKKPYKGKINNMNALFTSVLPMDFDGITEDEFKQEKEVLKDLGLETLDVYTGHGYQSFILLTGQVWDKNLLKKFTDLMFAKGFKVDNAITDAARVLRMPFSYNSKGKDPSSKKFGVSIKSTGICNWTEVRYHVTDVFKKINSLPDVILQTESEKVTQLDIEFIESKISEVHQESEPYSIAEKHTQEIMENQKVDKEQPKEQKKLPAVSDVAIQRFSSLYPLLDYEKLPSAVQKMLVGTQDGQRNKVILFLIPFLRNTLGSSQEDIVDIMTEWGRHCTPALNAEHIRKEVKRIYAYGFKGRHGKYSEDLAKVYGYINFEDYKRDNQIIIPNEVIEDFAQLSDGAVRIYLTMKFAEKQEGVTNFTKEEIMKLASISKRTLERNMPELVKLKYVSKKRSFKKNREAYAFYVSPYFDSTAGFTLLETALVRLMLAELNDVEMKLYIFLCRMVGNNESPVWASQKYLAKKIGKKEHSSISKLTTNLNEKKFIRKETIGTGAFTHSTYTMIY